MVVRILGIPNSPSANCGRNVSERCGESNGNVRRTDNSTDSSRRAPAQLVHTQAGEGWRRVSESNRLIEVLQTSAFPLGKPALPMQRAETTTPAKPVPES